MYYKNKAYKCCAEPVDDHELEIDLNGHICAPECRPENHPDWIYC